MKAAAKHNSAERPEIPRASSLLTSITPNSALGMARSTINIVPGDTFESSMQAEDAFVVLFQLRNHPAHDFRLDGKLHHIPATSQSTLAIIDLRGAPTGLLRHPVDTLFFHIPRAALDDMADEADAMRIDRLLAPQPWATKDSIFAHLQNVFTDALDQKEPNDGLLYDHLLLGLGQHVARTYGGLRPRSSRKIGGLAPWQERRAKELLVADLTGDITLQSIATQCSLSLGYFCRAFKATTGDSPHAWRQEMRITKAKKLMTLSPDSLADIAILCGFADQSHFSRVFVQYAHSTPSAWRRSCQEGGPKPTR